MNATDKDTPRKMASDAANSVADTVRNSADTLSDKAGEAMTSAKDRIGAAGETIRDAAQTAEDKASEMVQEGKSRVGEVLRKAQDTAIDAKDAIVTGAGQTLGVVKDVAVEKADAARETLSDVGERLAATLQRVSAESDEDALKSRMLSSVANGLTSASDVLRSRSVTDLTSDVKTLARKHPGAFMVAAAVAGFAAARFVRSSSHRRMAERDEGRGPRV